MTRVGLYKVLGVALAALQLACCRVAFAQTAPQVIDIATRPGITQRFLYSTPAQPKAVAILFAGGHGGLQIKEDGRFGWGAGNFLVRSRDLFVENGFAVAVIDAPSDRQSAPYLGGFRQRPEHAADAKAVIAWLRQKTSLPVWLVGTSRGTQSAAYIATQLAPGDAPNGIVLTATILSEDRGRPVPDMPIDKLTMPVLVVHHRDDGCRHCSYADMPRLTAKLTNASRKETLVFTGGANVGDPCEAMAFHGFNGIERDVVNKIATWVHGI